MHRQLHGVGRRCAGRALRDDRPSDAGEHIQIHARLERSAGQVDDLDHVADVRDRYLVRHAEELGREAAVLQRQRQEQWFEMARA